MRELALTLLLLSVVVVVAVRLIDLRTKLLGVEKDDPGPGGVLAGAARSVSRDVEAASHGGAAPEDRVRPVADDTGRAEAKGVDRYADAAGQAVLVRPGTDQLGLRGVIRSPLLAARPPSGAGAPPFGERVRRDPSAVDLRCEAPASDRKGAAALDAVLERLGAPTARQKRFFLVADAAGRYAVARLSGFNLSKDPPRALDVRLDFTDSEAASLNLHGALDAPGSLGEPAAGGLLDDLVWFVARGAPGRPPDYIASGDPPSMRFPHPYFAVAERAGGERWEITRVGEDVEDFQVAWGLSGAGRSLVWRGEKASSPVPEARDLTAADGAPALRALRLAWTAKSEHRYARADGPRPAAEFLPLFNAPAPGSLAGAEPVGWDADESRRVPFERANREIEVSIPAAGSSARR